MLDLYKSMFEECRTPERTEPMMQMFEILFENGYELILGEIEQLHAINDSSSDYLEAAENLIFRSYCSFMSSAGIDIDIDTLNNRPSLAVQLLEAITSDIEIYDDYDTLLSFFENDETLEFKLAQILEEIYKGDLHSYTDLTISVQERTMAGIKSVLVGRKLTESYDEYETADLRIVHQISMFIKRCPYQDIIDVLSNGGFENSRNKLIEDMPLDLEDPKYISKLVWAVSAIILTEVYNKHDAYAILDEIYSELDLDSSNALKDSNVSRKEIMSLVSDIYTDMPPTEYYEGFGQ